PPPPPPPPPPHRTAKPTHTKKSARRKERKKERVGKRARERAAAAERSADTPRAAALPLAKRPWGRPPLPLRGAYHFYRRSRLSPRRNHQRLRSFDRGVPGASGRRAALSLSLVPP
ncbi:unnamed protein product, partial [Ixodes pacificus]